jgi:hypothetical protein
VTTITVTRPIVTLRTSAHVHLPALLAEAISRDWQYRSRSRQKLFLLGMLLPTIQAVIDTG